MPTSDPSSERSRRRALFSLVLLTLMVFGLGAWLFREELLQRLVRPWLAGAAGGVFEAEVEIGELVPAAGGVLLRNVAVRRTDASLFAALPEIEVGFTLVGLLEGRLERVLLSRPELLVSSGGDSGETFSLPARPPVTIGALTVRRGGVRIGRPSGTLRLHGIDLRASVGDTIAFRLCAFAGEGSGGSFDLSGELVWKEALAATVRTLRWQGERLLDQPLTLSLSVEGEGGATGKFAIERLTDAHLAALFAALEKKFPLPSDLHFTLRSVGIDVDWGGERLRLEGRLAGGTVARGERELALASGAWTLRREEEGWRLRSRIGLAQGGRCTLRGRFGRDGLNGDLALELPRVSLPQGELEEFRLSAGIEARVGEGRLPGLQVQARLAGEGLPAGTLVAAGSGEWSDGEWRLRLDSFALRELEYLSPAGSSGFGGGAVTAAGTVSGETGAAAIALDLSGGLALGELLHGALYADLSGLQGEWSLRGSFTPSVPLLQADDFSFAVPRLGRLHLGGRIDPAAIRIGGELRLEGLGGALADRLLSALREAFPPLAGTQVSGALAASFSLASARDGWRLRGQVRPRGLGIERGGLSVRLAEGEVPFELSSGTPPESGPGEPRRGSLASARLAVGPARYDGGPVEVVASPNRFEIPGPIPFGLAGGRLRAEEVSFFLGEAGPGFAATIDIRDIDLERLTGELGWVKMAGRLDADLGRIVYSEGTLTPAGGMVIEAFGGTLLVSGIRLEAPFSSYPLLHGDIDFSGIDLHRLTRTFSFGDIHGVADGFVHDLRLYRFTPSRFEAVIETREEGRRSISVRALENLSIISQGGLSGALSRGLFRFIDFYRYRRIGIWCVLRRDVFVLRGTALDGSQRHLVYGGLLPPKIDIIAPEHAISFKEMLGRLERIDRGSAEAARN